LIYMGHNEFYGALGVGSTQQIGQNRSWILTYIRLQKLKTFQLVHDFITWIRQSVSGKNNTDDADRTLMHQVVKNQQIKLDSKEYNVARDYFSKNLSEIVRIIKANDVDVILSTLVSNLSDQEPFSHYFSEQVSDFQKDEWNAFYEQGLQLEASGRFSEAIQMYRNAGIIDNQSPVLHYRRGKCLQAIGQFEAAESEYKLAKDKDAIRFRATEEFNEIIRRVAYDHQVPLIEMEPVFKAYCKDSILGRTLFTDHLHPNFPGYFWMAKAFVDVMSRNHFIVPGEKWPWEREKTTDEYRQIAAVTDLEQEIANQRIRRLTSQWPFKEESIIRKNSGSDYDKMLESIVNEFLIQKLGWNEAHYKIADYLMRNNEPTRAMMEYKAVIKVTPFNYFPYIELADLHMRMNDLQEAENVLQKALEYSPHLPYAYAKLGMLYYFMNKRDQSIEKLEQAIKINKVNNRFTNDELAVAYYILSMDYGEKGEIDKAKQLIKKSLELNPDDTNARSVLETLNRVKM
ncbi:tetratricopeptide repeat protein, partial [candidate division KSB1 bacterium]|nr:tetratricopeptide repeat protein [candidate division KSB1 bacterium]